MEEGIKLFTEKEFEGDDLALQGYRYEDKLSIFIDDYVEYVTANIFTIFPKEYDAKIADCISIWILPSQIIFILIYL
jgi:hypothetical protein